MFLSFLFPSKTFSSIFLMKSKVRMEEINEINTGKDKSGGKIMLKILGDRIKTLRTEKNLTQEEMAGQIGVTLEAYTRIEDGTINIPLTILNQIAKVLEAQVSDITSVLGGSTIAHPLYPSQKISDMLDLFYANERLYKKMRH